jgi:hypothetical protein
VSRTHTKLTVRPAGTVTPRLQVSVSPTAGVPVTVGDGLSGASVAKVALAPALVPSALVATMSKS